MEAQAHFLEIGSRLYLPDLHHYLARAEAACGDLDAAQRAAAAALAYASAAGARRLEAMTQRVLAQLALASDDRAAAQRLLEASRQTLAELGDAAELRRTDATLRDLAMSDPDGASSID